MFDYFRRLWFKRTLLIELKKKKLSLEIDLALFKAIQEPEIARKQKEAEGEFLAAQKTIRGMDKDKRKEFKPKVQKKEDEFKAWNVGVTKSNSQRDQKQKQLELVEKNIKFVKKYRV